MKQCRTPPLAAAFRAEDGERVLVGFARVNHERQLELAGQPDLRSKDCLLHAGRREVVVVIEANLPDRPR